MSNLDQIRLTPDLYESITAGEDIRKRQREQFGTENERLIRMQSAILLIMYRAFPAWIATDDILSALESSMYERMEDGAFKEATRIAVLEKLN